MSTEPLAILFQDEWIVAVNKPAGQLVHPAEMPQEGDQVTMKILRDQIGMQVNVIHRLDRPTTGVLVFATERQAAKALHLAFERHEIEKVYWALVTGNPRENQWLCQEPIRKDKWAKARVAETDFNVLERFGGERALIEARPKTGRFHQIRRHLLHAGHPIIGDYRYGGIERCDELGAKLGIGTRMLLQAKRLHFIHPMTQERITIEATVDPMIQKCLTQE